MKLASLKKLRVVISLIFFISITALFLDYGNILSPKFTNYFVYLQFIPSILKFIGIKNISFIGFIFVVIITITFGRVYCSTICPLGILQDVLSYLARKIKKKKYYSNLKPYKILRYSFLVLPLVFLFFGSIFFINLLDPYSNFGRINTWLFKPVLIWFHNYAASILIQNKIYLISPVELFFVKTYLILFPLAFFSLIAFMSLRQGRIYCNTVCPVGTLLGLISKFSIFKIQIEKSNCISCKLCERVCKSGCIDRKNKLIDFDRCVNCYNCLTVCPTDGIKYKFRFDHHLNSEIKEVDYKKRKFIASIIFFISGLSTLTRAQKKIVSKLPSKISIFKKFPVSPPGSLSLKHFTEKCTACHLCVSSCPSQVIQPSFLEYGFLGMLQPRMDYNVSFCNYDCVICTEVCPSGAILPIQLSKKKLTQLGKAKFVKDNCIVYTEKTDCGACSEHCPTKAVNMIPYVNNLVIPEVSEEYCIGCGACEYSCPVKPYKAIYVEGNYVHLTAKKKEVKKIDEKVDYKQDFPF